MSDIKEIINQGLKFYNKYSRLIYKIHNKKFRNNNEQNAKSKIYNENGFNDNRTNNSTFKGPSF